MGLEQLSEKNVANSVSLVLASKLLAAGYLVYWHTIDALQSPDEWYFQYSTAQDTYLAGPPLSTRVAAAKGVVTIRDKDAANPEYPVRPTSDGRVLGQDAVHVPYLAVEVGPLVTGSLWELGNAGLKSRWRPLIIYGLARDESEQSTLRDLLAVWFDSHQYVDIQDHEAGSTTVVGSTEVLDTMTDSAVVQVGPDLLTYEVILNARLSFQA